MSEEVEEIHAVEDNYVDSEQREEEADLRYDVHDSNFDDATFRSYAQEKFDALLKEMKFRCQRAGLMHYYEANGYDRKCYYMELTAAIIGSASVSGIGAFLLQWNGGTSGTGSMTSRFGLIGLLGAGMSVLLGLLSSGSSKLIPTFSKRAEIHKEAAAGWQSLSRLAKSYRIQLRNPQLRVGDYIRWYDELVRMRESVSRIAMVSINTYKVFEDPGHVYRSLNQKRSLFLQYKKIKSKKPELKCEQEENY